MTLSLTDVPVRKIIIVNVPIEDAFEIFTEEIDTWWPRTHHIGKSPMRRIIVEGFAGGRCYTEQDDGTECDWARVLEWQPPTRLVLAWQVTHEWGYQPDLSKSSEVEVLFRKLHGEATRVDLEHRCFDRHGAGAESMRASVDAPNGWTTILSLFTDRATARGTRTSGGSQE